MKTKKTDKSIFSFHSNFSPCDFIARIKEKAVHSNLKIEQNDADFNLQLDSNHGGEIVYRATVSADENGGSYISGEITTIPYNGKLYKKKNIFEKIFSVLCYVIVTPFVLVFLLFYGIYMLFVRLFRGKTIEPTKEEKLCDFMIHKMSCERKQRDT